MPILNEKLPLHAWADPRTAWLPGIQPITDDSWIAVCDAYGAQMAERQCLLRLPRTQAVLFSIHTYQVTLNSLAPSDLTALSALGLMQYAH